jgi:hypothetical protein
VAAPFLGSIARRFGQAEPATPPRRLIAMFTHYGCVTTRFFPRKSHWQLTREDLETTTLRPLTPFVDKLLLPRGIRAMNEWTAYLLRGQGNHPHAQVNGSYFTCQPLTPNIDDPFLYETNPRFIGKPVGRSLDHVMAEQLSPDGTPLLVRVGNVSDRSETLISYIGPETGVPGIGLPAQLYAILTGLFTDGGAMSPDSYQAVRGKSVLDLIRDDLDTLERFDMSQSDRLKLVAWKELLDSTGGVVASTRCDPAVAELLGVTQANLDAAQASINTEGLTARLGDGDLDVADLCSNLVALAAVCNANPVIFLKYPAQYVYVGLGHDIDSEGLSHRTGSAGMTGTCRPGVIDRLLEIDDYYARKFAHLVGQLNSISEGEGTVLDGTAAVWFQEMSDGSAHNLNNLPIVQAGSAGGYFKTGWAINVEDGSADLTAGNSELLCGEGNPDTVNAYDQSTGTDPALANAPINKYYCNLMNALGVKAGEDGFPLLGGTAEVTHFGKYDKTEDFIGGEVNPPLIHDPGEFVALKANG